MMAKNPDYKIVDYDKFCKLVYNYFSSIEETKHVQLRIEVDDGKPIISLVYVYRYKKPSKKESFRTIARCNDWKALQAAPNMDDLFWNKSQEENTNVD